MNIPFPIPIPTASECGHDKTIRPSLARANTNKAHTTLTMTLTLTRLTHHDMHTHAHTHTRTRTHAHARTRTHTHTTHGPTIAASVTTVQGPSSALVVLEPTGALEYILHLFDQPTWMNGLGGS